MELRLNRAAVYRVRRGQSLADIARAFGVTARLLAAVNHLTKEPEEGEVLVLPPSGDRYVVRGGESRALLCGYPERFEARNGTRALYPGQEIII